MQLPLDLLNDIIYHSNLSEIVNLCYTNKTNYNYCKTKTITNIIKNKLDTTFNIYHFDFDELMLFYKANINKKFLITYNDLVFYQKGNQIISCDTTSGIIAPVNNINLNNVYQILPFIARPLLTMFFVLTNEGHIRVGDSDPKKYESEIIFNMDYNIIDGLIVITNKGKCIYKPYINAYVVDFKNVVQKAGIFIVDIYGDVYVELTNGKIYSPLINAHINFNTSFFSFYQKFYKLNVSHVKQVTIYGDMLTFDGKIYRFDWYTLNVNLIAYSHIVQMVNFFDYQLNLMVLSEDGNVYFDNQVINNQNEFVLEIHISNKKLIYLTDDDYIVSAELNNLDHLHKTKMI